MNIEIWHIWMIATVMLFIVEIFASSFVFGSLAIGCVLAGIVSAFDSGIEIQLMAFILGTLVAFFGIRPVMLKYFHKKSNKIKTNVDALIGKTGRVTEVINPLQNKGRIIIEGDDWKASTEEDEIVHVGEKVEIMQVDSTILIVKRVNK